MYDDLLKKYDFLTVVERRDYVTLKYMLEIEYKNKLLQCIESNSVDKLFEPVKTKILPLFKSELYKCSLAYRSTKIINSLPRDFSLGMHFTKDYMKTFVCRDRKSDILSF